MAVTADPLQRVSISKANNTRTRRNGVVAAERGNADAAMARWVSSAEASATVARTPPVAGSHTGAERPLVPCTA